MKKLLVVMGVAGLLAGCAGFQQAVTGYESAALKGIQAVDDNNIRIWATAACGTPFSAAIRNPQIVPALKALCLPGGQDTSPSSMLDSLLDKVPAGVVVAPSPTIMRQVGP